MKGAVQEDHISEDKFKKLQGTSFVYKDYV